MPHGTHVTVSRLKAAKPRDRSQSPQPGAGLPACSTPKEPVIRPQATASVVDAGAPGTQLWLQASRGCALWQNVGIGRASRVGTAVGVKGAHAPASHGRDFADPQVTCGGVAAGSCMLLQSETSIVSRASCLALHRFMRQQNLCRATTVTGVIIRGRFLTSYSAPICCEADR